MTWEKALNRLIGVVTVVALSAVLLLTVIVYQFYSLFKCDEKVVSVSASPDKRYQALITVCGGGALGSDVYRVRLRGFGETGSGDQVAQVSRRVAFSNVAWRSASRLTIRESGKEDPNSDLDLTDRWQDVAITVDAPSARLWKRGASAKP